MAEREGMSALALARALQQAGRRSEARALLDTTLAQPALAAPITVELAADVAWLHVERGGMALDRGELEAADADASRALTLFTQAQHRPGAGFAALLAGDVAAAAGGMPAAHRWWQSALALADAGGHGPLAARALCSMLTTGAAEAADLPRDAIAEAARRRLEAPLPDALSPDDPGRHDADAQRRAGEATLALCACYDAIGRGELKEARLLLPEAHAAAQALAEPGLQVEVLRLDASLARRAGDPRAAAASLARAAATCRTAGLLRLGAAVRAERILALCDDGRDAEAYELAASGPQPGEVGADAAGLPATHAAGLEAFCVLSLRAGNLAAARRAIDEALTTRAALGDVAALARCKALALEVTQAEGDLERVVVLGDALAADAFAPADARLAGALAADRARVDRGAADAAPSVARAALEQVAAVVGHAPLPSQLAWWLRRARAHAAAGEQEAAADALGHAERIAARAPLLRSRARVAAAGLAIDVALGEAKAALQRAPAALELARQASDALALTDATLATAEALAAEGRLDEAAIAYGHALGAGAAGQVGSRPARALLGQAAALARGGRSREAAACYERAADAALRSGATALRARALRGLATVAPRQAGAALQAAAAAGGVEGALARLDLLRAAGPGTAGVAAIDAVVADGPAHAAVTVEAALLRATWRLQALVADAPRDEAAIAACATTLAAVEAEARHIGGRLLGAYALLLGQAMVLGGDGARGGELLGEAMVLAAREGGQAAATARAVAERLLGAATPASRPPDR
ncbi:MAG: hypothetical protein H6747_06440 [Deltaproteobacteria bacterium]|nr:hypothetical protein [Deltaproteobacteria bacterium]